MNKTVLNHWADIAPLLDELQRRQLDALNLDFEDGELYALRRDQRWRFWRRPLTTLIR